MTLTSPSAAVAARLPLRAPAVRASATFVATTRSGAPRLEAARVADGARRGANAGAVLRTLLDHGPIARSTIARITGLSPAAVTGHCARLAELRLLRELPAPVRSNGAGRPHVPVDLDPAGPVVAAVHIAVPGSTVALLDLRGRVLAGQWIPHTGPEPELVVARAAAGLAELLAARPGPAPGPLGIGVATGGWVDPESGTVMDHPRLGWSLVPLRDLFAARTGLPVRIDGHARSLLHGELLFGRARRAGSALHLFVGNVVDAAFATRGEAHYGRLAQAGVVAHLPVEGGSERCPCGRTGCLEAAVSEQTLTRRAHEQGLIAEPEFPRLLEAASGGSEPAARLFVERAGRVGRAVASLIDVFGPELAVVTDPALDRVPGVAQALRRAAGENVRTRCDLDSTLMSSAFRGRVLETAGGAVILDALYRDPLALAESRFNSEACNVDAAGRTR
jgi:predicted NBD/HSP70 family sugar kinase